MWTVPLSQGPGAGIPPLPPSPRLRHGGKVAVASGAERTPRSEENRCPALAHSTGLGRSVPTGTKRAGPRPSSKKLPSHLTPTQDLTTIATHSLCTGPTLRWRSPRPSLRRCSRLRGPGAQRRLRP